MAAGMSGNAAQSKPEAVLRRPLEAASGPHIRTPVTAISHALLHAGTKFAAIGAPLI
jgi:hypothetical protein